MIICFLSFAQQLICQSRDFTRTLESYPGLNSSCQVYREGRGNEADYRKLEELYQRCLNAERTKDDLHLSLQTAQNKIKQLELK